jgi:hypothetical protein
MINGYLTFDQFKYLHDRLTNPYKDSYLFFNFLTNKSLKLHFISDNINEIIDDSLYKILYRNGLQIESNYPKIISQNDFNNIDFNLFSINRSIVFYNNKSKIEISDQNGIIYVDIDDINSLKNKISKFLDKFSFRPQKNNYLKWKERISYPVPVATIYYIQPYILELNENEKYDQGKIESVFYEIVNVFEDLILINNKLLFDSSVNIYLLYKIQRKKRHTLEFDEIKNKIEVIRPKIKKQVEKHFTEKFNIDCKFNLIEGSNKIHERLLISDYFIAQAGHEFTKTNILIDYYPILNDYEKYKEVYKDFVGHLKSTKINIMEP